MKNANPAPRTAAEINKRREEIGAELAKGRIVPVANARQLEAEDDRLRSEYLEALARESKQPSAEHMAAVRRAEEHDARLRKIFSPPSEDR